MPEKSKTNLNILVIGAGLGGLSAAISLSRSGQKVRVLESSSGLSEFGAGIQITPNATRILDSWGLTKRFEEYVHVPDVSVARRYSTGKIIGTSHQNPDAEKLYGYPYWQIYRPDFQSLLAEGALNCGAQIQFNAKVTLVDVEVGLVVLADGTTLTANLVICADGIRSRTRAFFTENTGIDPLPFKEYNYRAMIPRDQMLKDPETAQLMGCQSTQAWLGPSRAIVGYPVSIGRLFNLAISVPKPSDASIGSWNEAGDLDEFRSTFMDFCPLVQKVVGLVENCAKWTIAELPPLKTWSSSSGRAILLGDSAHAMSPHAAQGGAMAIEDAAVIGECLKFFGTDLSAAVKAYEAIRRSRVERVQDIARGNGDMFVLADGPEQEQRDARFLALMDEYDRKLEEFGRNGLKAKEKPKPDMSARWPHPAALMWLHGYDAVKEAKLYLGDL